MATTNMDANYAIDIEKISNITRRAIINDEEVYFDRNIFPIAFSSLIKVKERMMSKYKKTSGGQEIYFDVVAARKILHDILFMSFLIKKAVYLKGDIAKTNDFITDLQGKKNSIVLDNTVDAQLSSTLDLLDFDMMSGQVFINHTSLSDVIKEAVAVLEFMRNSFGHNANGKNCYLINDNSILSINNSSFRNRITADIDYAYFVDFCYGIKPLVKDNDVLRIVDDNHSRIFNELSLSAKDSLDLFYSTEPSRMVELFELVNHNYELLLNLPTVVFSKFVSMERILFLVKDRNNNIDPEKVALLRKLPVSIFYDKCSVDRIKMIAGDDINFNTLINLPDCLFTCADDVFNFSQNDRGIYYLIINSPGFDIARFKQLSSRWFARSTNVKKVKFLIEHFNNFDDLLLLNSNILKNDYPLGKLIKVFGDCRDVSIINSLPLTIFSVDNNFVKYEFLVSQIKKENPNASHFEVFDLLSKLPATIFDFSINLDYVKKVLKFGTDREVPISKLIGLDDKIFTKNLNVGVLNYFIEKEIDYDVLKDYSIDIFSGSTSSDFIIMLDKLGVDMRRIPVGMCTFESHLTNIKYLFNDLGLSDYEFIKKYFVPGVENYEDNMRFIHELHPVCFANYMKFDKFKSMMECGLTKDNLKYVPKVVFVNELNKEKLRFACRYNLFELLMGPSNADSDKGYKIIEALFNGTVSLEKFKFLCNENFSLDSMMNIHLPALYSTFSLDFLKFVVREFDGLDILEKLPFSFFSRNPKMDLSGENVAQTRTRRRDYEAFGIIKYFYENLSDIDLLKDIPDWCFDYGCSLEKVKYIYEKVDNNFNSFIRLPKELFVLDNNKIDSFFNSRTDVSGEMMKSLFGLNNSKALSLNLYFSTLSSVYEPSDLESYFSSLDTGNIDVSNLVVGSEIDPFVSRFFPIQNLNNLDLIGYLSDFDVSVRNDVTSYINRFVNDSFNSCNTVDLVNKYREVMGIIDGWGDLFLNKFNRQFVRRFRNSSDHFRTVVSDDGLIIMDGELTKTSSGLSYGWNTSCYATYSNWFDFAEQLKGAMLNDNVPSLDNEQKKKILINLLKVRNLATVQNIKLIDDFVIKIEKLKLELKELFALLVYMKERGNEVTQVSAVSTNNYSLLSLYSGFDIYSDYSNVAIGSSCFSLMNMIEVDSYEKEKLSDIRRRF